MAAKICATSLNIVEFDNETLCELVKITCVPPDRALVLGRCVQLTIDVTTEAHRRPEILAEKGFKPALTVVARRARALDEALANLGEGARIRLASARPILKSFHRGLVRAEYSDFEIAVSSLAEMAEHASRPIGVKQRGQLGRPPGSTQSWPFRLLIQRLFTDVECEGKGKLTLNVSSQSGSLPDALCLLRPCLPEGLIPRVLPYGTLKKIIENCRMARRQNNN